MKNKACMVLFILFLLLLCSFTSCATTTDPQLVEVSVPVLMDIDIKDLTEPVLRQRPDNSLLKINTGPVLEMTDVIENSAVYLYAWNMWQNYAEALEKTLDVIALRLKASENSV